MDRYLEQVKQLCDLKKIFEMASLLFISFIPFSLLFLYTESLFFWSLTPIAGYIFFLCLFSAAIAFFEKKASSTLVIERILLLVKYGLVPLLPHLSLIFLLSLTRWMSTLPYVGDLFSLFLSPLFFILILAAGVLFFGTFCLLFLFTPRFIVGQPPRFEQLWMISPIRYFDLFVGSLFFGLCLIVLLWVFYSVFWLFSIENSLLLFFRSLFVLIPFSVGMAPASLFLIALASDKEGLKAGK